MPTQLDPSIIRQYNIATTYLNKKKFDRAISEYKKLLKIFEFKEAYLNIGNAYKFSGLDRMSFESYTRALSPDVPYLDKKAHGEYTLALNNLGLYHFMYDKLDTAISLYDRALAINPEFWDAAWNKATAVLKQACDGRVDLFDEGWGLYRARFLKTPPVTFKNDRRDLVPWEGEAGVHVIIMVEQGIGDALQWGRYLSHLATIVGKIDVQCDASLDVFFSGYNCVRMPSSSAATHAIALCDLAKFFNSGIPVHGEWLRDRFVARSLPSSEKLRVGIAWQGNTTHANDAYRSVPIHRFHALSKYCDLYALSPGFTSTRHVKSLDIKSWSDTASAVLGLDLVIAVDTSVVHLAGSLGVETWLLQPYKETDFRWGTEASGSSNMWYNSVRVFRNPQSWDHVFSAVVDALKDRTYL